MKNNVTQIDSSGLENIMKDTFDMDIKKQLAEYQVEYNVLQEEISTTQHYIESLNREKANFSQVESKLQVKEISILYHLQSLYHLKSLIQFEILSVCRIEYYSIGKD